MAKRKKRRELGAGSPVFLESEEEEGEGLEEYEDVEGDATRASSDSSAPTRAELPSFVTIGADPANATRASSDPPSVQVEVSRAALETRVATAAPVPAPKTAEKPATPPPPAAPVAAPAAEAPPEPQSEPVLESVPPRELPAWMRGPWGYAVSIAAVVGLLWLLKPVLVPILLAFGVAYVFSPLVDRLEKLHVPRTISIAAILVTGVAAIVVGVVIVVPIVADEVKTVANQLPGYWSKASDWYSTDVRAWVLTHTGYELPVTQEDFASQVFDPMQGMVPDLAGRAVAFGRATASNVFSLIGLALDVILFPVFLFYALRDFPRMRRGLVNGFPAPLRAHVVARLNEVDAVLSGFIRGQLTVCLLMGVLYSEALTLTGIDLPVVIGALTGLALVIPIVGVLSMALVATIMAIAKFGLVDPTFPLVVNPHVLGVIATFAIGWTIEGNILSPRIVGEKVGLHPIVMITAVIVGGEVFGFVGVLLAVPATAVAAVFWRAFLARYRQSGYYTGVQPKPE